MDDWNRSPKPTGTSWGLYLEAGIVAMAALMAVAYIVSCFVPAK